MSDLPTADELQDAIRGLLAVEQLCVRLTQAVRRLEQENRALASEVLETKGQRDELADCIKSAEEALAGTAVAAVNHESSRCLDCQGPITQARTGRPRLRCQACIRKRNTAQTRASRGGYKRQPKPAVPGSQGEPKQRLAPLPGAARTESSIVDRYRREQEQKTETGAFDPAKVVLPERRCGRCCHKFQPTDKTDYYCEECRAKGAGAPKKTVQVDGQEFEVAWSGRGPLPGREDAPSNGSQLAPARVARAGF